MLRFLRRCRGKCVLRIDPSLLNAVYDLERRRDYAIPRSILSVCARLSVSRIDRHYDYFAPAPLIGGALSDDAV